MLVPIEHPYSQQPDLQPKRPFTQAWPRTPASIMRASNHCPTLYMSHHRHMGTCNIPAPSLAHRAVCLIPSCRAKQHEHAKVLDARYQPSHDMMDLETPMLYLPYLPVYGMRSKSLYVSLRRPWQVQSSPHSCMTGQNPIRQCLNSSNEGLNSCK